MKISEIITDKYKLRIPPTVYYELLADVREVEEDQEPTTKNDLGVDSISRAEAIKCLECDFDITGKENMKTVVNYINSAHDKIVNLPSVTPQLSSELEKNSKKLEKNFGELDCISRKAILDELKKWDWQELYLPIHFKQMLDELPTVTPQEPKPMVEIDLYSVIKQKYIEREVLNKIREQIKSNLRGVEIALEVLVENHPLRPKMEGAKDTLEDCLELIDKAETEDQDGQTSN